MSQAKEKLFKNETDPLTKNKEKRTKKEKRKLLK
jgi:hypothetical protein